LNLITKITSEICSSITIAKSAYFEGLSNQLNDRLLNPKKY